MIASRTEPGSPTLIGRTYRFASPHQSMCASLKPISSAVSGPRRWWGS
ncbi:hypothetical protein [Amycolatopsis albispora]|nr:hypothetical protein [Amycolatopsis albispora]